MQVPFFDLRRLYLEQKLEIDSAIARVLDSGWYILGNEDSAFELELAAYLGKRDEGGVIGCNSGTDALVLSLIASGVVSGDEVITPSHTAIPTITAIRSVGAKPKFIDIDSETWLLDTNQLNRVLSDRVSAVVCVHLYGNMVDISKVSDVLKKAGREDISIIEDVAQAHGAKLHRFQAGTLGRFGAFSFYPSKNIGALGDAGAVVCKTNEDLLRLRMLRNYGQKDRYNAELERGVNSRLDEIQAAVLSLRLKQLDRWNVRKTRFVEQYRDAFSTLPFSFQRTTPGCEPSWHLCVVALESKKVRNEFMGFLRQFGIETLIHYPHPTHLQPAFRDANPPLLPITEDLANRIISLPMNAVLRDDEHKYVIQKVKAFFR